MAFTRSHLKSPTDAICDQSMRRLGIPVVPTLLGVLAVLNVASVVMFLIE